jgi:hypothetical protein
MLDPGLTRLMKSGEDFDVVRVTDQLIYASRDVEIMTQNDETSTMAEKRSALNLSQHETVRQVLPQKEGREGIA